MASPSGIDDDLLRPADRMLAWLLVLFNVAISLTLLINTRHGLQGNSWSVFLRVIPYTPYSWGVLLLVGTVIYALGELTPSDRLQHHKEFAISGALLCSLWWVAVSLCLSRALYEAPKLVSDIPPLLCFFMFLMYAARLIIYANIFTGRRWNLNPFQMYGVILLISVSITQCVIGTSPASVSSSFERPTQLSLAGANLVGAVVAAIGLHLRNVDAGLWLELWGYVALVGTLGFYCYTVFKTQELPTTTLGFTLGEAFVLASFHRALQIAILKWAQYKDHHKVEDRMRATLTSSLPPRADSE